MYPLCTIKYKQQQQPRAPNRNGVPLPEQGKFLYHVVLHTSLKDDKDDSK